MSAKLVENVIGELMTFMLLVTLPVVVFYQDIPSNQVPLFYLMAIGMFLCLNFVLCFCAKSHALCARISKVAWLIVASIERYNIRGYHRSIQKSTQYKDDFGRRDRGDIDLDYYSNNLVTPHTVSLWRNSAKYNYEISDGFACRLLNKFKMDFVGSIRLNHWFASLMLLIATYYHHQADRFF